MEPLRSKGRSRRIDPSLVNAGCAHVRRPQVVRTRVRKIGAAIGGHHIGNDEVPMHVVVAQGIEPSCITTTRTLPFSGHERVHLRVSSTRAHVQKVDAPSQRVVPPAVVNAEVARQRRSALGGPRACSKTKDGLASESLVSRQDILRSCRAAHRSSNGKSAHHVCRFHGCISLVGEASSSR
jgi:hypothetical protein